MCYNMYLFMYDNLLNKQTIRSAKAFNKNPILRSRSFSPLHPHHNFHNHRRRIHLRNTLMLLLILPSFLSFCSFSVEREGHDYGTEMKLDKENAHARKMMQYYTSLGKLTLFFFFCFFFFFFLAFFSALSTSSLTCGVPCEE